MWPLHCSRGSSRAGEPVSATSSVMWTAPRSASKTEGGSSASATRSPPKCELRAERVAQTERAGEARGRCAPRRPARSGSTLAASHGLDIGWELNGAVFTAAPRGGRCLLELECDRAGIRHVNSRPYHPQKLETAPAAEDVSPNRAHTTSFRAASKASAYSISGMIAVATLTRSPFTCLISAPVKRSPCACACAKNMSKLLRRRRIRRRS